MSNQSDTDNETQKQLTTENEEENNPPNSGDDNKRPVGSRAMNLIKAALSMLRRKGGGKPPTGPPPPTTNASALTKLVGCIRPLHLQGGCVGGPPQPEEPGLISRYASAQSLCDLDDGAVNNGCASNVEVFYDGVEGDERIDAKADLFIAKFYEQMKKDHQHKTD